MSVSTSSIHQPVILHLEDFCSELFTFSHQLLLLPCMFIDLTILFLYDFGHLLNFLLQLAIFTIDSNHNLLIVWIGIALLSVISVRRFYFVMISEFYLDSISLLVISSVFVFWVERLSPFSFNFAFSIFVFILSRVAIILSQAYFYSGDISSFGYSAGFSSSAGASPSTASASTSGGASPSGIYSGFGYQDINKIMQNKMRITPSNNHSINPLTPSIFYLMQTYNHFL